MSKAYKIPHHASGKQVILINSTTKEKLGPFESITYVCKHILKAANRKTFIARLNSGQQYMGYILQIADENKDELLNLSIITSELDLFSTTLENFLNFILFIRSILVCL